MGSGCGGGTGEGGNGVGFGGGTGEGGKGWGGGLGAGGEGMGCGGKGSTSDTMTVSGGLGRPRIQGTTQELPTMAENAMAITSLENTPLIETFR
ncbi:MAG TPA: hypothetical protein VFU48_00250 [Nitrospira sp.]|nr:hypothetical protein [Nitrospira sp.]